MTLQDNAEKVDVLISGAGPAGLTASLFLSQMHIRHLILEKNTDIQDKICGGGLTSKVFKVLDHYEKGFAVQHIFNQDAFHPSRGAAFVSPKKKKVCIKIPEEHSPYAPIYTGRRKDFHALLFNNLDSSFTRIHWSTKIEKVQKTEEGLLLICKEREREKRIFCKLLIIADGYHSRTARMLNPEQQHAKNHNAIALRSIMKNVRTDADQGLVELHFPQEVLPGYFWIFPLPGNEYNVGMYTLAKHVIEKKIALKSLFEKLIKEYTGIRERFTEAEILEPLRGMGLPLAQKKQALCGDHYLLTGDAASLVNPLSGEGIGHAMYSGMMAARYTAKALEKKDFSKEFLQAYTRDVYQCFKQEYAVSEYLFRRMGSVSFMNFIFLFFGNPVSQWILPGILRKLLLKWS
jgi:menaquinone-9 beta-reductase